MAVQTVFRTQVVASVGVKPLFVKVGISGLLKRTLGRRLTESVTTRISRLFRRRPLHPMGIRFAGRLPKGRFRSNRRLPHVMPVSA